MMSALETTWLDARYALRGLRRNLAISLTLDLRRIAAAQLVEARKRSAGHGDEQRAGGAICAGPQHYSRDAHQLGFFNELERTCSGRAGRGSRRDFGFDSAFGWYAGTSAGGKTRPFALLRHLPCTTTTANEPSPPSFSLGSRTANLSGS